MVEPSKIQSHVPEVPGEVSARLVLEARGLTVRTRRRPLLRDVSLQVPAGTVLGLVGPSGAGKTTLLKCFNRLLDLTPGLEVEGEVLLDGQPIYRRDLDTDLLRARVGFLFQQPVIFPGSVYRNVAFGLHHLVPRRQWPGRVEEALREAALWQEVRDRLEEPAAELSVGQQQRLCLARALALQPEVILMDEPTGSLDPASTRAIEELVRRLAARHTVVLVTHDLEQARRVTDRLAVVLPRCPQGEPESGERIGELVEQGLTHDLFLHPRDPEVARYLGAGAGTGPGAPEAAAGDPASPALPEPDLSTTLKPTPVEMSPS